MGLVVTKPVSGVSESETQTSVLSNRNEAKKNTCVSGSRTDHKNSGLTLNFFFKKKSDFSYHKFARKLTKNG